MGLGALTLCAVENVPITYCPPLVYTVQFFHACDFACVFNHRPGSTVVFTVEKKNQCISEPTPMVQTHVVQVSTVIIMCQMWKIPREQ